MEPLTFDAKANYILNQIIFSKHFTKRKNVLYTLEFWKIGFPSWNVAYVHRDDSSTLEGVVRLGRIQMA